MSGQYEFEVGPQAALDARIDSGTIDVRNGPVGRITVAASGGDDDWIVDAVGDTVSIRPVKRRSRRGSARVVVDVPEGARIAVKSASAAVRLTGTFGDAALASASGDLVVDTSSNVVASTASGDLRVSGVACDASMKTASGDVEVGDIGGRLSASTASGDVRVNRVGGDVRVGTTSGDVRIDRYDGEEIAVKSVSGDVVVGLPSGIRVEPALATLSGETRLPARPATDIGEHRSADASPRRVVRVRVRTVSGDITIARAD